MARRASPLPYPGLDHCKQPDLFGGHVEIERMEKLYAGVDALSRKYGKHTVFLGSSFKAMKGSQHLSERGDQARRKTRLLKGETQRMRIGIPYRRSPTGAQSASPRAPLRRS